MNAQTLDHGQAVAIAHGVGPRSSHWPAVEKAFAEAHPDCIADSTDQIGKSEINIHHIHPYHIVVLLGRSDLELDTRNLTTFCLVHHCALGHLDDYQLNNEDSIQDASTYKGQTREAILANPVFALKVKNRPVPFPQWTLQMRRTYRMMLDQIFPPDSAILAKYFPNGLPVSSLI